MRKTKLDKNLRRKNKDKRRETKTARDNMIETIVKSQHNMDQYKDLLNELKHYSDKFGIDVTLFNYKIPAFSKTKLIVDNKVLSDIIWELYKREQKEQDRAVSFYKNIYNED